MKKRFWNIANLTSFSRIVLLIILVVFLFTESFALRFSALILCLIVLNMDWLDGYFARKFNVATKFGQIFDVMVDRIVENVLWIVFAFLQLVPVWAPIIIVIRGFSTEGMRAMAYAKGKTTFGMMKSKLGKALVASRISRGLINISKTLVFTLAIIYYMYQTMWLYDVLFWFTVYVVGFCAVRGFFVIWDNRGLLIE